MEQGTIRLVMFASVLIIMALLEAYLPRRERTLKRSERWLTNLTLSVVNVFALKLLGPMTAIAVANYAVAHDIGLLSFLSLPLWLSVVLGVIVLDMAIYAQHVASHKFPLLWRFHKVHHADQDIDVTTGIRFHPVEALFSMLYKCLIIIILGPLPIAVFVFEVLLNASAMFNHANTKLPLQLDNFIRKLVVTPDMHRVHHSIILHETDSNYGFFLSIWDRLFKTYTAQPQKGHKEMVIGLEEFQTPSPVNLLWNLKLPFK